MRVASERNDFSTARVAVLESSKFAFQLTRSMLAGFGFRQIIGFETATEAMEKLAILSVDLFLCDPHPSTDESFAALRTLRESRFGETAIAPMIIVTSNVGIDVMMAAKECQADFVIAKPFSPQVLLERIIWSAKRPERRDALTKPSVLISASGGNEVELW